MKDLRWEASQLSFQEYWPKCKCQFSILHEGGISHIERCTATQRWPWQQNVTVLQKKCEMVKHSLLVLAWSSAEVAEESATSYHHLMRCILISTTKMWRSYMPQIFYSTYKISLTHTMNRVAGNIHIPCNMNPITKPY